MPRNNSRALAGRDLRCQALVLRRTNYGEADRILNLITPNGLVSLIAKGVRREKSKLAGGIELFCLSEITYHQGQGDHLGILTSAKMQKFYQNILGDFSTMNLAAEMLKKVAHAAEQTDGRAFYDLTLAVLEELNRGSQPELIETYFWLNFANIKGEAINFNYDTNGVKLQPDQRYAWDSIEQAFAPQPAGDYASDEIKYLRLMLSGTLPLCARVQYPPAKLSHLLYVAKSLNQF